jgi:hypothetical protein
MFDTFEPFQELGKKGFVFNASRFEIWAFGKIVSSGPTNSIFYANVVLTEGLEKVEVTHDEPRLKNELSAKTYFDKFITATDRLQLVVIPEVTNSENVAIMMFRLTIGTTCQFKFFRNNEPFCCNLFLQNGRIVKITFSFSNPEKLIEFYNDSSMHYGANNKEGIFDSFLTNFERLRKGVLGLPLNLRYFCTIYNVRDHIILKNEVGELSVDAEEIIFRFFSGSLGYIVFNCRNERLFCKNYDKNGHVLFDYEINKVEFSSIGKPEVNLKFDISEAHKASIKEFIPFDLNFVFISSDHIRYENGKHISGPHGGARRAVKVEPNISGGEGVTVTMYNLDGNHPIWQNNVQMAPKQMKVIEQTNDTIVLRGYGHDSIGASFSDYGLTIKLKNGQLENCILHMYDRGVDIEYLP